MQKKYPYKSARSGKVFLGMFLLIAGSILLLKKAGLFLPDWIISWPMFFIVFGLYNGIKHNFRRPLSFFLIAIGSIFLLDKMVVGINISIFIWPVILMGIGLYLIMGRNYKGQCRNPMESFDWDKRQTEDPGINPEATAEPVSSEPVSPGPSDQYFLDTVSVFGGVKKNIVSKNFRGGEIVNVMGGTEINLSQADIQGRVVLDITQIFGGTKIIVPPHWEVHPEMTPIFGGIEDKRPVQVNAPSSGKVLVIRGTSIFGGIDIRSYY